MMTFLTSVHVIQALSELAEFKAFFHFSQISCAAIGQCHPCDRTPNADAEMQKHARLSEMISLSITLHEKKWLHLASLSPWHLMEILHEKNQSCNQNEALLFVELVYKINTIFVIILMLRSYSFWYLCTIHNYKRVIMFVHVSLVANKRYIEHG